VDSVRVTGGKEGPAKPPPDKTNSTTDSDDSAHSTLIKCINAKLLADKSSIDKTKTVQPQYWTH
jgi:hypothetical protein